MALVTALPGPEAVQPGLGNAGDYRRKKEIKKIYRSGNERYFSLHELAASIENGCCSCKLLHAILVHVSLVGSEDPKSNPNVV